MSANQKRVIKKRTANFRIENGEMIFEKKCRGKDKVRIGMYSYTLYNFVDQ